MSEIWREIERKMQQEEAEREQQRRKQKTEADKMEAKRQQWLRQHEQEERQKLEKARIFVSRASDIIVPILEDVRRNSPEIRNAPQNRIDQDTTGERIKLQWGNKIEVIEQNLPIKSFFNLITTTKLAHGEFDQFQTKYSDYYYISFGIDGEEEIVRTLPIYQINDRSTEIDLSRTSIINAVARSLRNPNRMWSTEHKHSGWKGWHDVTYNHYAPEYYNGDPQHRMGIP